MSTRLVTRGKGKKSVGFLVWLRRLLLTVLVAEAGLVLWSSPPLRVDTVRVEGARLTSQAEVIKAIPVQRQSSWALFSTRRAARRLQQLPTVAEALVWRQPIGVVRVKIFERQPAAHLQTPTDACWLDSRGIAFWRTASANGLPVIRVERPLPIILGQPVTERSVQAALEVLCRHAPKHLLPVTKVEVDREGNLCLNMKEGKPQVRIGDSRSLEQKMERTAQLWAHPQIIQHAEYLDVSCVEKPVWKPRWGGRSLP